MQEQEEPVQPFGVTLIAALTAILPLVVLLRGEARNVFFLSALVGVIAGTGLFFQKPWGRWLTILYWVAGIVLSALQWKTSVYTLLAALTPILIVSYLFLPKVRATFDPKKP